MNLSISRSFMLILISLLVFSLNAQTLQTPIDFFGFQPGTDRMLFTYEELIDYLQVLEKGSAKLKMEQIGESPMGRPIYIAIISSEQNIAKLPELKQINRKLALDADLSEPERKQLILDGKVFVLATLSMHSGEVGPSQSAAIIAHELLTAENNEMSGWLENVVYMMVPCHNPDGMDMIVDHYKKYKGTKYEGSSMPGIYHKYVGHDNNRDFVILSQTDTKAIASIYNLEWFPQVMVEKHQMGSRGPRYFVPPNHDPIAENIDAGIWNWTGIFGSNIIKDMTAQNLAGISQHYAFDDYWPGSTETCIWKNVIGFLTEAASVKYASPIYIEPNELAVRGKGLSEYKKSINMPLVWPGGWWRLGDIVEYEIVSTYSILKTANLYHDQVLTFRNDICRKEVKRGRSEAPYYYILPKKQHDQSELVDLVHLLTEHGVNVYELSESIDNDQYRLKSGDVIIPLAQSFRPFIKEVMELQNYPVRHYTPGGEIIKPYDITSWSLPPHRGLSAVEVNNPIDNLDTKLVKIGNDYSIKITPSEDYNAAIFTATNNESYKAIFSAIENGIDVNRIESDIIVDGKKIPAGSFMVNKTNKLDPIIQELGVSPVYLKQNMDIKLSEINLPRIALVETYFHDMDAGWTRFVLDSYHIPFKVIRPGEFEKTNLSKKFDVVIFPDVDESVLMKGKYRSQDEYYVSSYPPEFTKGIGKPGIQNLLQFIEKGGLIVSWGRSTRIFKGQLTLEHSKNNKEEFHLPFSDISERLRKEGLYCPGSFVNIQLNQEHELTRGLPGEIGVFFRGRPVFTTTIPNFDMDRRVLAKFPEKDILLSGYCEKEELLADRSVMVWLKKGKGQLVLFGFNPQFRASTTVSYKLLFNSILLK